MDTMRKHQGIGLVLACVSASLPDVSATRGT